MGIVIRQAAYTTFFNYLGVVLGFINLTVLMSHWFTVDQLSLTRVLLDIAVINIQISHLGSFRSIVRFFPFFNKDGKTNGLMLLSVSLPFFGFLLVAAAFILFKDFFVAHFAEETMLFESYYWGIIPLTFFLLYNNIFEVYLQAHSQTVFASFLKTVFIRILVSIALVLFYFEIIDFHGFMLFFVFSYLLNVILFLLHLQSRKLIDLKMNPRFFRKKVLRIYSNFSFYSILSNISATLVNKIDAIMVVALLEMSASGVYSMAAYLSILLYIPAQQISKIAFPIIAKAWNKRKMNEINEIYKKSSLNQLLLGGLVFILVWFSIDNFYALQKEEYATGKYVFFFLGLSQLINMTFGVNGQIINISKYYRFDTLTSVILAVLAIATNLLLIPAFGITGAAMATAFCILLFNISRGIYLYRKLHIHPFSFSTLKALAVLGFAFMIGAFLPNIGNIYLDTIVKSIILTIAIVAPLVYFKISEDIVKIYRNIIARIF